jgi:hypothetical protein
MAKPGFPVVRYIYISEEYYGSEGVLRLTTDLTGHVIEHKIGKVSGVGFMLWIC